MRELCRPEVASHNARLFQQQTRVRAAFVYTSSAALNNTGPGKLLSFSQVCARQPGDFHHPRPQSGEQPSQSVSHVLPNPVNVVLYGMDECPPGMSKFARFQADMNNAVKVFSSIDNSIQCQSIKDCFRLGKFSSSESHPRPVLVKFIRITSVLSKKRKLSHPYSIKPDKPREQCLCESVLMKERWHLIQSGVHRNIKDNYLFVGKKLHGHVTDSMFKRESARLVTSTLEGHERSKNVVDGSCIVEGNHDSVCLVPSTPSLVQPSTSSDNRAFLGR